MPTKALFGGSEYSPHLLLHHRLLTQNPKSLANHTPSYRTWYSSDWTSSNDSIRGGSSYSKLSTSGDLVIFSGHLDIKTLGGAGFASQRTSSELDLDLSAYDGIELVLGSSDGKKYTFVLKDDDGEANSINWQVDFQVSSFDSGEKTVNFSWWEFNPIFKGKEAEGVEDFKKHDVKRMGFMFRRYAVLVFIAIIRNSLSAGDFLRRS
jgi:hypothetical protein